MDKRTKLGEMAGSTLELTCPNCQHRSSVTATELMIQRGGAARLSDILNAFKCTQCGRHGAPRLTATVTTRTGRTLGDIEAHFPVFEIKCSRCDRHGRIKTSNLIAQHGRDMNLTDLGSKLIGDCPKRQGTIYERCDPYFPQLSKIA